MRTVHPLLARLLHIPSLCDITEGNSAASRQHAQAKLAPVVQARLMAAHPLHNTWEVQVTVGEFLQSPENKGRIICINIKCKCAYLNLLMQDIHFYTNRMMIGFFTSLRGQVASVGWT